MFTATFTPRACQPRAIDSLLDLCRIQRPSSWIDPALFRHVDELRRRDEPGLRAVPAHQRLDGHDAVGPAVHLRLEIGHELVVLHCAAQMSFEQQALQRRLVQRTAEELEAVAARVFRVVKRGIGVLEEFLDGLPVLREHADAHAGRHEHLAVGRQRDRLLEGVLEAAGDARHVLHANRDRRSPG
jgi:hypothetical protein